MLVPARWWHWFPFSSAGPEDAVSRTQLRAMHHRNRLVHPVNSGLAGYCVSQIRADPGLQYWSLFNLADTQTQIHQFQWAVQPVAIALLMGSMKLFSGLTDAIPCNGQAWLIVPDNAGQRGYSMLVFSALTPSSASSWSP